MAFLSSVEGFFNAVGGEELEIDFPADRVFRKIGVYLRLLFSAVLVGISFGYPKTCYLPGPKGYGGETEMTEELTANYINLFCFSTNLFLPLSNSSSSSSSPPQPRPYLFSFLPYSLALEALLAYLPYLVYSTKCRSTVLPLLNEARDMALLTGGTFEERKGRSDGRDDDDDSDVSDDEENYAKSLITSLKKRLHAKASLFVTHRLKGVEGFQLVDAYHLCNVFLKGVVVVLQLLILLLVFTLSFPFPSQLSCPLSSRLESLVGVGAVDCVFPFNGVVGVVWGVDALLTAALPIVSASLYASYWRNGFYRDLKRARRMVPKKGRYQFDRFVKHMFTAEVKLEEEEEGEEGRKEKKEKEEGEDCEELRAETRLVSRQVDDVRLTFALLLGNVDKLVANKIMTVYAGMVDFEKSDAMEEKGRKGGREGRKGGKEGRKGGRGERWMFRWMRPTLPKEKWEKEG